MGFKKVLKGIGSVAKDIGLGAAEDVFADVEPALGAVARELLEPLVGQVGEDGDPAQLARIERQWSFRYWWTSSTAIEPSPTAEATRLID